MNKQPKGGMCAVCEKALRDCSDLPFDQMPVIEKPNIVRCNSFQKSQEMTPLEAKIISDAESYLQLVQNWLAAEDAKAATRQANMNYTALMTLVSLNTPFSGLGLKASKRLSDLSRQAEALMQGSKEAIL